MHGKLSQIAHRGKSVFQDLPPRFTATRYHSLVVERASLPACLEITAETDDGLIMGLANDRSLAWGIARALGQQGAELAFSYQGEALHKRVAPLAAELGSDFLIDCDVSDMAALDAAFDGHTRRGAPLVDWR